MELIRRGGGDRIGSHRGASDRGGEAGEGVIEERPRARAVCERQIGISASHSSAVCFLW